MLLTEIEFLIGQICNSAQNHPHFFFVLLLLFVSSTSVLVWRLFSFTLGPYLHASEPKELPYWVPFLGHAIAFIKGQDDLFTYARVYFGDTREPFIVTLGREKLYILTAYQDVIAAYKNLTTLNYGEVIRDLAGSFGLSKSGLDKLYAPNPMFKDEIQRLNPQLKSLFDLKSDFYHIQLQHPEQLTIIQAKFLSLIDNAMRAEMLPDGISIPGHEEKTTVSLYKLCQQVFVKAGLRAFFGEQILTMDPDLLSNFIDFDNNNWMIWYNWPKAPQARDPMEKVKKTIESYLTLPKTDRPGAAWLISTMEEAQRQLGMEDGDIAIVLLMFIVNTNAYRVAFWALAYIMHSPTLYETIHTETAPAINADGTVNAGYLVTKCPHLHSLWLEVLRMVNGASAARAVVSPTTIGTKTLKPGYKVLSPFRQLHFDPQIYPNPNQCDPDRFFRDKTLERHPSFKPFGGGVTKCPGRNVARQEVFVFVGLVLHRFAGKLASGVSSGEQPFPRMQFATPTTGVVDPRPGEDVAIKLYFD
ncbi:cytochrome P450 protein [Rutstroemia sp. NJR-2017a BBW]|nr:cytochrome P450 protein [Rutstroemia sp. NJR-2017a BBW]